MMTSHILKLTINKRRPFVDAGLLETHFARTLFSGTLPADWTRWQINEVEDVARKIRVHECSTVSRCRVDPLTLKEHVY